MAKLPTAKKAVPVKAGTNTNLVVYSDEDTENQEIVLVTGNISAGKTFLAGTASDFWPAKLPAAKMVTLEDMFWLQFDAKATAGFKHNNIKVATFDVNRFMSREELWSQSYRVQPTIVQAIEAGLQAGAEFVAKNGPQSKIVVDTLSKMDYKLFLYHSEKAEKEQQMGGKENTYRKFDLNLMAHNRFHESIKGLGADIIYCCHLKAEKQDADKAQATKVIGGASWVPDLIGQAPKYYKSDETLQLVLKATRAPRSKEVTRRVLIGINDEGYESKNRYEGLLPNEMEADLGKIMRLIRGK